MMQELLVNECVQQTEGQFQSLQDNKTSDVLE